MQSTPTDKKNIAYATASDVELLQHIKEGDKWAFVEIVSRYQATVSGVALAILRDFAASEDVAQETFLSAWQKIDQVKQGDKLRAWLCSIARTTALMHLRKRKKEVPLDSSSAGLVDFSNQPDESLANDEDVALVLSALDKLPSNYRLPLVLFYREGKSVRAVAEALDITEMTAKKRLSRGREMLREGISELVESVLKRRLPTATFTMAIAASIGALNPPSAVAGTVFITAKNSTATAGFKAASSVPTLNGGNFFLAPFIGKIIGMTTMTKFTCATVAAIAACLTAGYYKAAITTSEKRNEPHEHADARSVTRNDRKQIGGQWESEIGTEWRRLQKQFGTDDSSWSLIHSEIQKNPSAFKKRALLSVLASEWAKNSPKTGLIFYAASSERDPWQSQLFANELVVANGWEALDMISENAPSLKWGNDLREWVPDMMEALQPKLLQREPKDLAAFINDVKVISAEREGYRKRTPLGNAFGELAKYNLKYAVSTGELVSEGHKKEVLAGISKAWAEEDGLPALEWAQKQLKGADRDRVVRYALQGLAKVDPVAALERVGMVPPGNGFYTTEKMVLRVAAEKDLSKTLSWMREHPKAFGKFSMSGLQDAFTAELLKDSDGFLSKAKKQGTLGIAIEGMRSALMNQGAVAGRDIWKWLSDQEDSGEMMHLRRETLGAVMWGDPEGAIQILSQMPEDEMDSLVKQKVSNGPGHVNLLRRLLGQGGVDKLDHYLSLASPDLQTRLVETSFRSLREKDLHDPEVWAARLSQVPEEGRLGALKSLSTAWAQRDPEGALAWAGNLADENQKEASLAASLSGWAKKDLYEAVEWVEQLPSGDRRDTSFISLAEKAEDMEVTMKLIGSIESPTRKIAAIQKMSIAPLGRLPRGRRLEVGGKVTDFISRLELTHSEKQELLEKTQKMINQ